MQAQYLAIKNWGKHQHYKDKEPGWIKAYARLLRDSLFLELTELEQWQLVRIWLCASQSSRFMRDQEGRRVPVVPFDEQSLRRAIGTVKKIPLARFIRDGWLLIIDEHELELLDAVPGTETPDAGPAQPSRRKLDDVYTPSRPGLDSSRAGARTRGNREPETSEIKRSSTGRPSTGSSNDTLQGLPIDNELEVQKLLRAIRPHGDQGTPDVIRKHAAGLPESSLVKVRESLETTLGVRDRARYAVAALKSEHAERSEAA